MKTLQAGNSLIDVSSFNDGVYELQIIDKQSAKKIGLVKKGD